MGVMWDVLLAIGALLAATAGAAALTVAVLFALGFGPFEVAFLSFMNGVSLGGLMPRLMPWARRRAAAYLHARRIGPEGGA